MLALCAVGMSLFGCTKENNLPNEIQNNTPTFQSVEDLDAALKKVAAMGEDERRAYEAQQGYQSLYTEVHEWYDQIVPERLTDLQPLYQHVEDHSDWVEIRRDQQGELEYRPIYSENPYSLLAGPDRMLIVGESALKVFDDGFITAPLGALEALRTSSGQSVQAVPTDKSYAVTVFNSTESVLKSNCGRDREDTETNGNNRTKLSVECYVKTIGGIVPVGEAKGQIIPQKRTLGVWFRARRTISGRFKFEYAYEQNGTSLSGVPGSGATIETLINDAVGSTLAYSVTRTYSIPLGGFFPFNYRFSSIDSWATTPSTGNATIVCH